MNWNTEAARTIPIASVVPAPPLGRDEHHVMPAISEDHLHNLPPQDRRYDAPVADELVLNVFPNGVKTWVHVYPFDGFVRRRTIGVFPDMSLEQALASLRQSQQLVQIDVQESRRIDETPAFPPMGPPARKVMPIALTGSGVAVAVILVAFWMAGTGPNDATDGARSDTATPAAVARDDAATGIIRRATLTEGDTATTADEPDQPIAATPVDETPGDGTPGDGTPVDGTPAANVAVVGQPAPQPTTSPTMTPEPASDESVADEKPGVETGPVETPVAKTADTAPSAADAMDEVPLPGAGRAAVAIALPSEDWGAVTRLDRIGTPILALQREREPRARGSFDMAPNTMATGPQALAPVYGRSSGTVTTAQTMPDTTADYSSVGAPSLSGATAALPVAAGDAQPGIFSLDGAGGPIVVSATGTSAATSGDDEQDSGAALTASAAGDDDAISRPQGELMLSRLSDLVEDNEPVGEIDPTITLQPQQRRPLFYLTEVRGLAGQQLTHRWEHDGEVISEPQFDVRGNRWRVYSQVEVPHERAGEWRVSVLSADGSLLGERRFSVQADDRSLSSPESSPPLADTPDSGSSVAAARLDLDAADTRAQADRRPEPDRTPVADGADGQMVTDATAGSPATVATADGTILPVVVLTDPDADPRPAGDPEQAESQRDAGLTVATIERQSVPDASPPTPSAAAAKAAPIESFPGTEQLPGEPLETSGPTLAAVSGQSVEEPPTRSGSIRTPDQSTEQEPVAVAAESAQRPELVEPSPVIGEVVKVRGTLLTLRALDGGGRSAYRVPRGTTVLLDGVETRLQDLLPGQVISIKTGAEIRAVGR